MDETKSEIIKALAKGDLKAVPGAILVKYMDYKQFADMFVDAGAHVAEYERTGTEEAGSRATLFCESNMRSMAEHMRKIDDFSWWQELRACAHSLLEEAAISDSNKQACERHFCEIIEHRVKSILPQIYERSLLQELRDSVANLGQQVKTMDTRTQRILQQDEWVREIFRLLEEGRQNVRQEHSESTGADKSRSAEEHDSIPEWHIKYIHVEGVWKPKENREKEICMLIEKWEKERNQYPGWYILPSGVCRDLERKSGEHGLLQSHTWMDLQTMLDFAYELVWRWEKSFHLYSIYDCTHVCAIWNSYAEWLKGQNIADLDEKEVEHIRKWFYIGQALLRVFREYGVDAEWKRVYDQLRHYEIYGTNGKTDLQLEKAKREFHHLNLPGLRRELSRCQPNKTQYEQRLQVLGLRVECGEAKSVIPDLQQLIQELKEIVFEAETKDYRVSCLTLRACALQLLSLCVQGVHDYGEEYEEHQEEINGLLDEIEGKKALFDWDEWKADTEHELLRWKTKKHGKSEPFELNRETVTLFGGENYCEEAYSFYRVLERLALPLRCSYVTLLGDLEQPWMEAILEFDSTLGLFLVMRSNRSDTLKTLVDRAYVTGLGAGEAEKLLVYLLDAMDANVDELHVLEPDMAGSIAGHMKENAPELLLRLMSRCPENLQKKALLLIKKLMEDEELPVDYPLARLIVGVMKQVSEKQKARMLGTMMETAICEHRTLHEHGDGLDLFDYYFCKIDIGAHRSLCKVEQSTIEWLTEPSEEGDYTWRTKIMRLEVLDDLGLLSAEQRQAYARLLWSHVSEETGLPMLTNLRLWAYEKLPCVDAAIPAPSVKGYFLNRRLRDEFADEQGWKISMGEIPYLDELISLCQNVEEGYWKPEEAEKILENILDYWDILQVKVNSTTEHSRSWSEYRRRAQKMVRGAAAVCGNLTTAIGSEVTGKLMQMTEEMRQIGHGVSTKELELMLGADADTLAGIREELRSGEPSLAVGALLAAYQYIRKNPKEVEAQEMLDDVLQILRYRKMPGLVSAVWIFQNLVYEECPILNEQNCAAIDNCLLDLADVIRPDNESCDMRVKDILSVRKACAALAYQLYHRNVAPDGPGVLAWKALADGDEVNDVKNEWVE